MPVLVAGAGFEPATFGLWARRSADDKLSVCPINASEVRMLPNLGGEKVSILVR